MFEPHQREINRTDIWELKVREEEIKQVFVKLEVRKARATDSVSGHVLMDYTQKPICDAIKNSLHTCEQWIKALS